MTGCPCGTQGKCCDNTSTMGVEHECDEKNICEGCFELECKNCGERCCCDL